MRLHPVVLAAAAAVSIAVPARAAEPATAAAYAVVYLEVGMPAARAAAGMLRQSAEAARKAPGTAEILVLSEIGRPDRFAIFEAFRDAAARDAQSALRDKLDLMLAVPPDRRTLTGVSVAASSGAGGRRAVYVLTHVDVVPTFKDQARALCEALAATARKEPGNLRFDVLVQDNRANHFTLLAGWRGRRAFEAHATTAATRDFRQKLLPMQGALYDERLYRVVP
jgi:quinol monooxygenase YgiN